MALIGQERRGGYVVSDDVVGLWGYSIEVVHVGQVAFWYSSLIVGCQMGGFGVSIIRLGI